MKAEDIERLALSPLKAKDGTYGPLTVLQSGAGFYIGRLFKEEGGFEEPGSRESDYFLSREAAAKALMEGFEWRNVGENLSLYETHHQLRMLEINRQAYEN